MKKKICFRADANAQIGYGHFIRTLALADMLKENFDCVFYTAEPSLYQMKELKKVCSFVPLSEKSKFVDFLDYLNGTEIVVLDNYFYTTDYQQEIKARGCKLVCIDDMHDKHYVADVVINHGLSDSSIFDVEPYTKLCLGFDYALLRAPFLKPVSPKPRNNDLVINFGGADPFSITERIVSMLLQMHIPYNLVVILGDKVQLSDENRQQIKICKNLSAEQMVELFDCSAAGVLSASTVCIEAMSRQLPIIAGFHVENQKDFYQMLASTGGIIPLGFLRHADIETLGNAIKAIDTQRTTCMRTEHIKDNYLQVFHQL